ncbi:TPA: RHS repeat protein [Salmonella enterica]|nr:RHS repeat protein [Salmonella enterica]
MVPFNRITTYRGNHYRYDEFGRTVEKRGRSGTQSYRYDAEHRMVEATTAQGTYRYVYDALGRREVTACISTVTRGVMNRWRGWIRREKRNRTGYCIFTRM